MKQASRRLAAVLATPFHAGDGHASDADGN